MATQKDYSELSAFFWAVRVDSVLSIRTVIYNSTVYFALLDILDYFYRVGLEEFCKPVYYLRTSWAVPWFDRNNFVKLIIKGRHDWGVWGYCLDYEHTEIFLMKMKDVFWEEKVKALLALLAPYKENTLWVVGITDKMRNEFFHGSKRVLSLVKPNERAKESILPNIDIYLPGCLSKQEWVKRTIRRARTEKSSEPYYYFYDIISFISTSPKDYTKKFLFRNNKDFKDVFLKHSELLFFETSSAPQKWHFVNKEGLKELISYLPNRYHNFYSDLNEKLELAEKNV